MAPDISETIILTIYLVSAASESQDHKATMCLKPGRTTLRTPHYLRVLVVVVILSGVRFVPLSSKPYPPRRPIILTSLNLELTGVWGLGFMFGCGPQAMRCVEPVAEGFRG